MLSGNCTEALSIQANVTISGSSAKLIKNGIAPLPFPPRAAEAILVHKARGEGQGEGTCSILCNVRVYISDFPRIAPLDLEAETEPGEENAFAWQFRVHCQRV